MEELQRLDNLGPDDVQALWLNPGHNPRIPNTEQPGACDNLPELMQFADKLEAATIQTIEDGVMTGDLYLISKLENKKKVNSKEFLEAIRERLDAAMQ